MQIVQQSPKKHVMKSAAEIMSREKFLEMLEKWAIRAESNAEADNIKSIDVNTKPKKTEFERFKKKGFHNYEIYAGEKQQRILSSCRRYAEQIQNKYETGEGLLFVGKSGTGKNHLLYEIYNAIQKAEYSLEIRALYEIVREIKTGWNVSGIKEQDIINKYVDCDFLVIEEIGVQYDTNTEKLILFDIINKRYQKALPTILTSNNTTDEFKKYIDWDGKERVWDRLMEMCDVLYFDWESYRRRK